MGGSQLTSGGIITAHLIFTVDYSINVNIIVNADGHSEGIGLVSEDQVEPHYAVSVIIIEVTTRLNLRKKVRIYCYFPVSC